MKELLLKAEDTVSSQAVWNELIQAVPGVEVKNAKELPMHVKTLFTFCPLYERGLLNQAGLVVPPSSMEESRVHGKWIGIQNVLTTLQESLSARGRTVDTTIVFANKGVLLNRSPQEKDEEALLYHAEIYQNAVGTFCENRNIDYKFLTFEDCHVQFPRFVNLNDPIPEVDIAHADVASIGGPMIELLNGYMKKNGIQNEVSGVNRSKRKVLRDIINGYDEKTAFWLVAGYLAFDYQIPKLIGDDGIYMSAERYSPLFRVANLTPGLDNLTRVEIKA